MKKIQMITLIICLMLLPVIRVSAENHDIFSETAAFIYSTVENPSVGSIGGEWTIISLARSSESVPDGYFEKYYKNLEKYVSECDGVLHSVKYTEYSRVVIAVTALGKNPENVAGFNLIAPLCETEKVIKQGINGAIWALTALSCSDYKSDSAKEYYLDYILENQNSDGGWSLSGERSDVDITAMALQALSDYKADLNVSKVITDALGYLSTVQGQNGGFSSGGTENSECCAQVITALCELNIPLSDNRFVKNGTTMFDNLKSYYVENAGFKHTYGEFDSNLMTTEQAMCALVSLKRFETGVNSFYDMSDAENVLSVVNIKGLPGKHPDVSFKDMMYPGRRFSDVPETSAEIIRLAEYGIVSGKSEQCFEPGAYMARAEFATIVVKALGLPDRETEKFHDVTHEDWFFPFVGSAYAYGIISGVTEESFNPGGIVTRQEAAAMVKRAAALCGIDVNYSVSASRDTLAGFSDYRQVADWALESVAFCYGEGILSDDVFDIKPTEYITRSEMATMVYNLLVKSELLR